MEMVHLPDKVSVIEELLMLPHHNIPDINFIIRHYHYYRPIVRSAYTGQIGRSVQLNVKLFRVRVTRSRHRGKIQFNILQRLRERWKVQGAVLLSIVFVSQSWVDSDVSKVVRHCGHTGSVAYMNVIVCTLKSLYT